VTDAEKVRLLTDGLKQMLGAFDTPVARMRMKGEFYEESRAFARDCYEKATGSNLYEEKIQ
jgi:hypothetical protein